MRSAAANEFRPAPAQRPSPAPPPPPSAAFAQERTGADAAGRLAADAGAARTRAEQDAAVGLMAASPDGDDSPGAGLAGTPALAPAWEAGTDVRLLSLRLQTLQQQSAGVAWDEPPAPLGAAEAGATVPQGFNAVGARSAPARFQVRVGPPGSD
jgi:hypothetical protein